MNYFPFHIGDFDRATRHLTRIERSIYLDLIFVYYDTEQALTLDVAALCRKIVARSEEEKSAVLAILDEFFHETPTGWFHDRCEEEIAEYRKKSSQASNAGKASAAARAERRRLAMGESPTGVERRANGNPTDVERTLNGRTTGVQQEGNGEPTNQEPRTSNQKPEATTIGAGAPEAKKQKKVDGPEIPDWMPMDSWNGYLDMRKARKKSPTPRAMELLIGVLGKMRDAGHDIAAILDTSTKNCWTDVYLPKGHDQIIPGQRQGERRGNGRPSINSFDLPGMAPEDDPFNTLRRA